MRKLRRPTPPEDPYKALQLPISRPIAVYYRQSTMGQFGNVSTTLQTVDMLEYLLKRGWRRDLILMIDLDRGISGTKGVKDRAGLSTVFALIERGEIGAVATQDVDRFFREMAQIETNIFIDACRRKDVLILTPNFVYDFAHPAHGHYDMRLFREQVQRASDFIEYQIRGRLLKARNYYHERGIYVGGFLLAGFMVDKREKLPDGSKNKSYRKYVRFGPWADVVLQYFKLFCNNHGDLGKTWQLINNEGPFFPEISSDQIPNGFFWRTTIKHRSSTTGKLTPSKSNLLYILSNVTYIGHWVHQGAITQWNNHEAIIPLDLFLFAYNRFSSTDFEGNPNPDYLPYQQWLRDKNPERAAEPTYSKLIFSDDVDSLPRHMVSTSWNNRDRKYDYCLTDAKRKVVYWRVSAQKVDEAVDRMLLDQLDVVLSDPDLKQTLFTLSGPIDQREVNRIEAAIRDAQSVNENLLASLDSLTNTELLERVHASRLEVINQISHLDATLKSLVDKSSILLKLPSSLNGLSNYWKNISKQEKRELFTSLAVHISITKLNFNTKRVAICWRDGSVSARCVSSRVRGNRDIGGSTEVARAVLDRT